MNYMFPSVLCISIYTCLIFNYFFKFVIVYFSFLLRSHIPGNSIWCTRIGMCTTV